MFSICSCIKSAIQPRTGCFFASSRARNQRASKGPGDTPPNPPPGPFFSLRGTMVRAHAGTGTRLTLTTLTTRTDRDCTGGPRGLLRERRQCRMADLGRGRDPHGDCITGHLGRARHGRDNAKRIVGCRRTEIRCPRRNHEQAGWIAFLVRVASSFRSSADATVRRITLSGRVAGPGAAAASR